MKWTKSLQVKYLTIIFIAVLLIPISLPVLGSLVFIPLSFFEKSTEPYEGFTELENMWHKEAKGLEHASDTEISEHLHELHKTYTDSQIFWVDRTGKTRGAYGYKGELPDYWTPSYTIQFMKNHFDADPFTVVAFLGSDPANGFMVIKVDRVLLEPPVQQINARYGYLFLLISLAILILFIFLSWLFFYRIHKRLNHLTHAMQKKGELGIPDPIAVAKMDEIGQLETSFNRMIHELAQSRKREQEAETLRKDLIANLSHDLRTPLTTIRAHLSLVKEEVQTMKGHEALTAVDQKIDYLSNLIDNLFSYTLLSAGKYPYHPEKTELNRLIRKIIAGWYPVLEEHQFEVDLKTYPQPMIWTIDPAWMERIMENLLQNVIRHASTGKFIGISIQDTGTKQMLIIKDKGNGFKEKSDQQGAGIGLTIVDAMISEMGLTWTLETSDKGTTITITNQP